MSNFNGSSLIEVLIALAIFSFSSMSLLQYQFNLIKTYQAQQSTLQAEQSLNDLNEIALAKMSIPIKLAQHIKKTLHGSYSLVDTAGARSISIQYQVDNQHEIKIIKRLI